jgi:arylsulfatase A-like enzyme
MVILIMLSFSSNIINAQNDFSSSGITSPTKKSNPNIIVIIADDLGYGDLGFNGCKDIPTPNIDKIAAQGVKFTHAYVTYPVCGPSRAGIITGRYQDRFGFGRNPLLAPNDPNMGLPLSEETMAEALKKANYKTVAIGKWHLGSYESLRPINRGFDDFFGFYGGGHQYFPEMWTLNNEYEAKSQYDNYKTKLIRNADTTEEDEYITDAFSREAVSYMEKYKNDPFFIYLAYNAPHTPLQATEKYLTRFGGITDIKRKTYAAMVSAMDDGVGRILDKLEELHLSENTIIFFLSDNGGPEQANASDNGILRGGKSDLFEGGIHVPFAVKWPLKIPKGIEYNSPVISLDIFATAIAQSDIQIKTKNNLDGVNLLPYITCVAKGVPHDFLFWRKFDQNYFACLSAGGEKLIINKENTLRFDVKKNPSEDHNIKENQNKEFLGLLEKYKEWNKQMIDPIFYGLESDKEYSDKHPDRFKKSN